MNAVAATVSFAVQGDARQSVLVDFKVIATPTETLPIMDKTTVAIARVGTIAIAPQIKNRTAPLTRRYAEALEMREALQAAVSTLAAALLAAAQRKEHVRLHPILHPN